MSIGPRGILVRVLGRVWVEHPGSGTQLEDTALRAVLAALAVRPNEPVTPEELIAAGWPGQPPGHAEDALGTRISRLRTMLAPTADVVWSGEGYVLRLDTRRLDATRFEQLVGKARHARPSPAIRLLNRALALWRGPLAYADLRPDGLDHPQTVRLGELRMQAIEHLARCELALGDTGAAAARLLEVLRVQPFREQLCALAMRVLQQAGRHDDALATYAAVRERLAAELGADPSTELRETYRTIAGRQPERPAHAWPVRAARHPPPTSLVGRDSELARLTALAQRERLVTVTGPGGVGKTRLLLEALSTVDTVVATVELSTVGASEVPLAVAAALGVHARGGAEEITTAIADCLAGERVLLALDNCEPVLTAVRTVVKRILTRCPRVTMLATSRVPLGIGGERVLPLAPLPADAATRLFLDRATTRHSAPPTVDGLPLHIELAAAHATSHGAAALRGMPRDAVTWAADGLAEADRELLAALTVFHGDLDLPAAEAVTDAAEGLSRLTAAGLLTVDDRGSGPRYRMPELVRQLAARRFAGSQAERKTRDRHARWCLDLVSAAAAEALAGADQAAAELVRRHAMDIGGALRWASEEEPGLAAELTGRLGLFSPHRSDVDFLAWQLRLGQAEHPLAGAAAARATLRFGDAGEAVRRAEHAAALASTAEERYLVLHTMALAYRELGDPARSATACQALLAMPELPPACHADAHSILSLLAADRGDLGEGSRAASTARALAASAGAAAQHAFAWYAEGEVRLRHELADGVAALARARAEAHAAGATVVHSAATAAQAAALVRLGRMPEAAKLLLYTLDHGRRQRCHARLRTAVLLAGTVLDAVGEREPARALLTDHDEPAAVVGAATLATAALGHVFGTLAH
ncbi:BTAD domain-containing putative transcriptional regulator [Saccharomonospora sp. NPDC046836]|uniref:BTAD domain-containing putative transcriptional regulator n=1 Tax=Saccharomonospora sp. NPDC046836 TaxID=3156921 RepID=UPI0033C411BD